MKQQWENGNKTYGSSSRVCVVLSNKVALAEKAGCPSKSCFILTNGFYMSNGFPSNKEKPKNLEPSRLQRVTKEQ